MYYFLIFIHSAIILTGSAIAGETSVQIFVNSINSVNQVKLEIKEALSAECDNGSCWNWNASRVCNLTAGLDVRTGYLITRTYLNDPASTDIPIADSDLRLMRLIFSQCKPTTYQYTSTGQILHVVYEPSPKKNAEIRKLLGLKIK
jgi:hypothetical protein